MNSDIGVSTAQTSCSSLFLMYIYKQVIHDCGPGSVSSIATGHGLEFKWIESWWG